MSLYISGQEREMSWKHICDLVNKDVGDEVLVDWKSTRRGGDYDTSITIYY